MFHRQVMYERTAVSVNDSGLDKTGKQTHVIGLGNVNGFLEIENMLMRVQDCVMIQLEVTSTT